MRGMAGQIHIPYACSEATDLPAVPSLAISTWKIKMSRAYRFQIGQETFN